jgi:hypothetical protein
MICMILLIALCILYLLTLHKIKRLVANLTWKNITLFCIWNCDYFFAAKSYYLKELRHCKQQKKWRSAVYHLGLNGISNGDLNYQDSTVYAYYCLKKKLCSLFRVYLWIFCDSQSEQWLHFVADIQCVFCEVETEFVNII